MDQTKKLLDLLRKRTTQLFHQGQMDLIYQDHFLDSFLKELGYPTSLPERKALSSWVNHTLKLQFLRAFLLEPSIEEVHLHSHQELQLIYKDKKKNKSFSFFQPEDYQLALEWLCLKNHQQWNHHHPCISFTVQFDQLILRYTLIHYSITPKAKSKLFIRKLTRSALSLHHFSMTSGEQSMLFSMLEKKQNILISGSTGAGKSSFLNTLLNHTNPLEHVVILEDSYELQGRVHNTTHLLADQKKLEASLLSFCHYALRLRPDRLVLGEVRGPEVVPLLLSMNTGHRGFISTLHANNAVDAISRVALLFQIFAGKNTIQYSDLIKMICHGIDYVIHINNKRVEEIIQILGSEGTTPYYKSFD